MSVTLYNLSAAGEPIPREYDYSTSRIAVLGDPKCGKSSLIVRWVHGFYEAKEHRYMEDIYHKHVHYPALIHSSSSKDYQMKELQLKSHSIEGNLNNALDGWHLSSDRKSGVLDVQVLDGQNLDQIDYSELRSLQIKQTDGFILCFDINDPESLANIPNYVRHVWHLKDDNVPILLCATKTDLLTTKNINIEQVMEVCEELNLDFDKCFRETSALEDFGVGEAFFSTLTMIEESKRTLRMDHQTLVSQQHERKYSGNSTGPDASVSPSLTATEQNSALLHDHNCIELKTRPADTPSQRSTESTRSSAPRTSTPQVRPRKLGRKRHNPCCVIC